MEREEKLVARQSEICQFFCCNLKINHAQKERKSLNIARRPAYFGTAHSRAKNCNSFEIYNDSEQLLLISSSSPLKSRLLLKLIFFKRNLQNMRNTDLQYMKVTPSKVKKFLEKPDILSGVLIHGNDNSKVDFFTQEIVASLSEYSVQMMDFAMVNKSTGLLFSELANISMST
ncbi:unnamed protein product, partial [Brugia pahangi]|uniref:MPN domain-containing protein n=1 Tax=Brugia pahangi TaxID=6280 RepID=A0A0N4T2Z7_BRUPA